MTQEFFSFEEILTQADQNQGSSPLESLLLYNGREFHRRCPHNGFQEASTITNTYVARELSKLLVKESGEPDKPKISEAVDFLTLNLYPFAEDQINDTPSRVHLLNSLKALQENDNIDRILKKISCPSHTKIQQLIKSTLSLHRNTSVTVQHARQAALSALFSYLRQDVGSCFVTAPAIIVHKQYPELFLSDIEKLINTGKLPKLYNNHQITVPINLTGGLGCLKKPVRIYDLFPDPLDKISSSPGILGSFIAIKVIPADHPNPQEICLELLANEYIFNLLSDPYNTVCADDIIKNTLLSIFELTTENIESHIFLEGIKPIEDVVITSAGVQGHSKTSSINKFLTNYREAKEYFVGLTVNPLLKCWELSLASLAEMQNNSSLTHTYVALGLDPQEPHGFHAYLQEAVQDEVDLLDSDIATFESRYEHVKADLAYIETRSRLPLNRNDAESLSIDLRLKQQEMRRIMSEWDQCQEQKKLLTKLPFGLLNLYKNYLSSYFHSLYDAEMKDSQVSHYQDQPAGFRIYYTHGRSNPTSWTPIYSLEEYIYAVTQFLSSTEVDITEKPCYETIKREISRCIGKVITRIHTHNFQESSFTRIAEHYGVKISHKPLDPDNRTFYKPWIYISGGTVESFLKVYFNLSKGPQETTKHPDSPAELAAFFSDSIKDLSGYAHDYLANPDALFLASSPTHVFSAIPGNNFFKESWDNNWYSYTWIRDVWEERHKTFFESVLLNGQHIAKLVEICLDRIPQKMPPVEEALSFFEDLNLTIPEFYHKMIRFLQIDAGIANEDTLIKLRTEIAGIMFSHIPLISEQSLPEAIDKVSQYMGIFSKVNSNTCAEMIEVNVPKFGLISPGDFRTFYKTASIKIYAKLYTDEDFHLRLLAAMRHHKLLYPAPLIIGDANWDNVSFGFTVHPGTLETDFWTFDTGGVKGNPMPAWKPYFSTEKEWKLFPDPQEYGFLRDFNEDGSRLFFS